MNQTKTLLVVFAIIFFARGVWAQPLANRIPADAMIYAGWAGADAPGDGFEGSHLKAMLDASEFRRFVNDVLPKVFESIGKKDRSVLEFTAVANDILKPMWRHPTALYVGSLDLDQGPMPRIAFLCAAGKDSAALEKRVNALLKKQGGNPPVPVTVKSANGMVAIIIGEAPLLDAVMDGKAKEKSLAGSKNFVAAMSMQKSPVLAAYVDAEAIVELIDAGVEKEDDAEGKEKWTSLRNTLGLAGLKRLSFAQGFDGKDWSTHAFLDAPAPRAGLLKGLDAEPISDAAYRVIPSTATVAGVGRADLAKMFDGFREGVKELDDNAAQELDNALSELNRMLGLDIRQDLIGVLGNEWAYFIAPEITGRGPLGVVLVNRLQGDETKAQAASEKLKTLANDAIAREADKDVTIRFKQGKVNGVTVHYLALPLITPTWAIQNGNIYFGLYPQVVADAATHVSKEGKSILDNPAFAAMRKRLGGEKAVSVQFYDLPRSAPTTYQSWMMISSFSKVGDLFGVDTPAAMLPPLSTMMQHMAPAGSVSYVDDRGWHFRAVSPFPGSTILASDAGGMDLQTNALLMSVMLPSLNRAREQANRVKSASNLRQIGLSAHLYANDHKGEFPDDLAGTLSGSTLDIYINPNTGNALPSGLEGDDLKQWVNEESDYVWVGKGKTFRAGADEILAHERPEGLEDGISILFADGHVEFVEMSRAQEMIGR